MEKQKRKAGQTVAGLRAQRGKALDAMLLPSKATEVRMRSQSGSSERMIGEIIERATEVLGNRDKAFRWLGNPVAALDFATPISIIGSAQGVTRVNDILTQMEHGVW